MKYSLNRYIRDDLEVAVCISCVMTPRGSSGPFFENISNTESGCILVRRRFMYPHMGCGRCVCASNGEDNTHCPTSSFDSEKLGFELGEERTGSRQIQILKRLSFFMHRTSPRWVRLPGNNMEQRTLTKHNKNSALSAVHVSHHFVFRATTLSKTAPLATSTTSCACAAGSTHSRREAACISKQLKPTRGCGAAMNITGGRGVEELFSIFRYSRASSMHAALL